MQQLLSSEDKARKEQFKGIEYQIRQTRIQCNDKKTREMVICKMWMLQTVCFLLTSGSYMGLPVVEEFSLWHQSVVCWVGEWELCAHSWSHQSLLKEDALSCCPLRLVGTYFFTYLQFLCRLLKTVLSKGVWPHRRNKALFFNTIISYHFFNHNQSLSSQVYL